MRVAQMLSRSPSSTTAALLALLFTGVLVLRPPGAQAQSDDEADSLETFQYELSAQFSGSQSAFRNWQEGGLNTLSFGTSVDGTAQREKDRWNQIHQLRLTFGVVTSEADDPDEPIRKTDDLIRAESNLRYTGSGFFRHFEPTISARLRTQFAKGFDYSNNPYPTGHPFDDREPPVTTSAFFAPAFITESLGLTYAPEDWYTLSLGAASKQTVVTKRNLRVLYDVDRNKTARVEAGLELGATIDRQIAENIRYRSSATTFYAVGQIEEPPDVLWENYITMRVNSWLTTNLEFVALFDENTSSAIQMKEVLSVGVTVDLI